MSTKEQGQEWGSAARLIIGVFVALVGLAAAVQLWPVELPGGLQDFVTLGLSVIIEALPFVTLGIVLSIVVRLFVPSDWLLARLPKHLLLRRVLLSLTGMLLPVCECGNVPLARGLMMKGLTPSESLTFLLAAPILNPITIITTQQAFAGDAKVVVLRVLSGFVLANLIGWLYRWMKYETMLKADFAAACRGGDVHNHTGKWQQALELFAREARAMMPALVIGALAAAALQVLVPRDALMAVGTDSIISVIAMLLLAFVVSVCSSVDAFFALAFHTTFTTGALLSFLIFGPMIDIKMLSLLRTTYSTRVLVLVTGIAALGTAVIGVGVNYVF